MHNFKDMQQLMKFAMQFSLLSGNTYDFFAKHIMVPYRNIKLCFLQIVFGISVIVLFLATTIIFVSHTAHQIGSFGKSLTQFETDYVEVAYVFNDEILTHTGYRVFQDKGFIVLREKEGRLHYIEAEQIEVRTVLADQ